MLWWKVRYTVLIQIHVSWKKLNNLLYSEVATHPSYTRANAPNFAPFFSAPALFTSACWWAGYFAAVIMDSRHPSIYPPVKAWSALPDGRGNNYDMVAWTHRASERACVPYYSTMSMSTSWTIKYIPYTSTPRCCGTPATTSLTCHNSFPTRSREHNRSKPSPT